MSAQQSFRVLVADPISDAGVKALEQTPGFEVTVQTGMKPDELCAAIPEFDGMIVRSATKATAEVLSHAKNLKVIGRAGSGVDNIDLDAATKAGVVVMNTPGGNSVAAAELTIAHLMALARNVPQSNADLREGRWERKKYMGTELDGKTIGVVGLGKIGREVARRAQGLRMKVIGFDPYVSKEAAADFGVEYADLETMIPQVDVLSLHIPRTDATAHIINADAINKISYTANARDSSLRVPSKTAQASDLF